MRDAPREERVALANGRAASGMRLLASAVPNALLIVTAGTRREHRQK
jgi:hypothetical protein